MKCGQRTLLMMPALHTTVTFENLVGCYTGSEGYVFTLCQKYTLKTQAQLQKELKVCYRDIKIKPQ